MRNYILVALLSFSFLVGFSEPANAFNPAFLEAVVMASSDVAKQNDAKTDCTQNAESDEAAKFVNEFNAVVLPFCVGAYAVVIVPYLIYREFNRCMKRPLGHANPMPLPMAGLPAVPAAFLRDANYPG